MIDRATQQPVGVNQYTVPFNNVQTLDDEAPMGNTSAAALRRLRKDRPDLHAKVLARVATLFDHQDPLRLGASHAARR